MQWKKPITFGLYAALGALLCAALGEVWLAATAPLPPPPPPPPPPAPPQAVVLLLDTSFSMMGSSLRQMKDAASAYVGRQNMGTSRIGVVNFDSQSRIDTVLSYDATAIKNSIDQLDVDGSTRMDLGLSAATSLLPMPSPAAVNSATKKAAEQRNILLFTDGYPDDNSADGDPVARTLSFAAAARQSGIRIVAIGTDDADKDFLAQVTGDPNLVFAANDGQFGEAFQRAESALNAPTGHALIQSAKVDNFDASLELMRVSVWAALLGLGIATSLILSQGIYARQGFGWRQLLGVGGGILAGLVAGALGQWLFVQAGDQSLTLTFARLAGWALGGALLGLGIAPFIPNLSPLRAGLGGALGGWVGAMGFIVMAHAASDIAGRTLGAAIIGFAIGLMVVLAEVAFRKAWLHVSYGPKDAFDLNLGTQPVAVGSDRSQCRIFARETPPLAASYVFENNQAFLIDRSGGRRPLQAGDIRRFGNVEITLCSEATSPAMATPIPVVTPSPEPLRQSGGQPAISWGVPMPNGPIAPSSPVVIAAPVSTTIWILQGVQNVDLPANGTLQLGRIAGNDIVINDAGISSRHAVLTISGDTLFISDHGSTNGTFVNGQRLAPNSSSPLRDGDSLRLARLDYVVKRR